MENLFKKVIKAFKGELTPAAFENCISLLKFKGEKDGQMEIFCPNTFVKKRFQEKHLGRFLQKLRIISNRKNINVLLKISKKTKGEKRKKITKYPTQQRLPGFTMPHNILFKKDFTFETFVVGANNDLAFSASLSFVAEKLHQPLLLLAKTGLGKSHLSQAIGNELSNKINPDKILYLTANQFSSEMVRAFGKNNFEGFLKKYTQGCKILILEEVHFLAGKTGRNRTQETLVEIIDHLSSSSKQVCFTSVLPIDAIPKLNPQLKSRLRECLIAEITPPDFNTRVEIVKKRAEIKEVDFPKKVVDYIAANLAGDIRPLLSGVSGIIKRAELLATSISMAMAKDVVASISPQGEITPEIIKKLTCEEFGISLQEITLKSRRQKLVRARKIGMYLCRRFTDATFQVIGETFNRSHAIAIGAVGDIKEDLENNISLAKQIEILSKKLAQGDY